MTTTKHHRPRPVSARAFALVALVALGALVACDTEDASRAVVDNGYPQTVVYRAWWVATYFPEPVAGARSSAEQRSVPATDFAYAVLAPDWDPASSAPPSRFVVVRSKAPLSVARGDTLHITVDDQTFTGNCAANQPLSQEEAELITQRIFPGEFANLTYDARTCTSSPVVSAASDAGADADREE